MASGSSTSLHSSLTPSPSASFSSASAPTTGDSDTSLGNVPDASPVREVRFDDRCVVIPEKPLSRPSRLRTGTFEVNLPFKWPLASPTKEKHFPTDSLVPPVENDDGVLGAGLSASPPRGRSDHSNNEATQRAVLKLHYPVFHRKSRSSSRSSVTLPPPCLRHSTLPPSSAKSATFGHRNTSLDSNVNRSPITKPKRRSASLSSLPLDPSIETVPLRPCCEKCLAAAEVHWNRRSLQKPNLLPTLQESSREHTPSQSRVDLSESAVDEEEGEDWCAGLHFTKGALKLWRSASVDQAGSMPGRPHTLRQFQEGPSGTTSSKLLDSLVRVDEVDRKRGSSPSASPTALAAQDEGETQAKSAISITVPNLERVKRIDGFDPPSPTASGSDESAEDLFPLPSPKYLSPAGSPSDSVTCLPAQIAGTQSAGKPLPAEPRQFETAIRLKMAEREKGVQRAKTQAQASVSVPAGRSTSAFSSNLSRNLKASAAVTSASAPIPIPGAHLKEGVSHFHSNLDEIQWDPSLPDPDALPMGSPILLNSPPGSPTSGRSRVYANGGDKHQASTSLPALPHVQITRRHTADAWLPSPPKMKRASGPRSNPISPPPASSPASASIPGVDTPSSPPPTQSSVAVSTIPMHGLTQSRSNTEERRTSPPSPQTPRKHATMPGFVRAGMKTLRGLSPTSSINLGTEAAGYSRGVLI